MNTKELQSVLNGALEPHGYRQRKDTWYKANDESLALVNLQKSQWGGQYYVNLGLYFSGLGAHKWPLEYQAHLRTRLTSIAASDASIIEEALDLQYPGISAKRRRDVLTGAITRIAIPFLGERGDIARLRQLFAKGDLGPVMLSRRILDWIEDSSKK